MITGQWTGCTQPAAAQNGGELSRLSRSPVIRALIAFFVLMPGCLCLAGFDLARHSVPPNQILDGGPPKDGIPAILQPKSVRASDAVFMMASDRVVGVVIRGKPRAYPLKILNWHEVVDDVVADNPFAVTYCPLTASAIVYERKVGKKPVTLGVSGKLYESNLLFYDKATESLWSQIKGEAIAGPLSGQRLEALPSVVTTWETWRAAHPDTLVLDVATGYARNYAIDPYQGYESSDQIMFPVTPLDSRLPAKERVLGLIINGMAEAFPFSRLAKAKTPANVDLGGQQVTLIFDEPTQTAGALAAGKHIAAYTGYWFAWAALYPQTAVWNDSPALSGSVQSGIYGFSGVISVFGEDRRGALGECIWIYDAANRNEIAAGSCFDQKPGEFRVPLRPGRYVVRGPGGNQAIEVGAHQWARVDSILKMAFGPP